MTVRIRAIMLKLGWSALVIGAILSTINAVLVLRDRQAARVSNLAPNASVGAALYTQNFHFRDDPRLVLGTMAGEAIVHASIRAAFVERAVVALDREPAACEQRIDRGEPRQLHVFDLPTQPPTYAIAFFVHGRSAHRSPVGLDWIDCRLADAKVAAFDRNAPALLPVGALVANTRLEYLTHAELRALPARLYPPPDKVLERWSP